MKLLIGTRNRKKLLEIQALLESPDVEVLNLDDTDCSGDVVEDGATLKDNAVKKALEYAAATGLPTVADDSGLEVDYLGGAPGIHSARYAGADQNDRNNIKKMLEELKGVDTPQRTARFRTVVALALPGKVVFTTEGSVEGFIATEPTGTAGFGYDPIFYHPPSGCTFAELKPSEKNKISHRSRALRKFKELFEEYVREV